MLKTPFKFLRLFILAALAFSAVGALWATPQNLTVQLSDTNPAEGATISVTITFCDTEMWATDWVYLMGAVKDITLSAGNFETCGAFGQTIVQSDTPTTGCKCYPSYSNNGTNGCPGNTVTAVWSVYLDPAFAVGGNTYHFVVGAQEYSVGCYDQATAVFVSQDFTVQPPPTNMILTASAAAADAAPHSLIKFSAGYRYVNAGTVSVSLPLPPGATFVEASGTGVLSGGTVTWNLPATAGWTSGEVWALVRVDASTADGTVLTADFSGTADAVPATASAFSTVHRPNLTLLKTVSSPLVNAGDTLQYGLDFTVDGQSLQWADTYDHSPGPMPSGFDLTAYDVLPNGGSSGAWNLGIDASGNQYINANGGGSLMYPQLLRASVLTLCDRYTVQGDLYIDSGNEPKRDAHLVIAHNGQADPSTQAYMIGISEDAAAPGRFFIQKNDGTVVTYLASQDPLHFALNTWYTVKAQVTSSGTDRVIEAKAWLRGDPEPAGWSMTGTDTSPWACNPAQNYIGWQADEQGNRYDNLMLLAPGPVVNPVVTDNLPTGVSFDGSNLPPVTGAPSLSWTFPVTLFGQPVPLTWWGMACLDPIVNQASISADGIPAVDSNQVTTNVTGACGDTPTPTQTPVVCPCDLSSGSDVAVLWTLNENTGTVTADVSGHGFDGTLRTGGGCAPPVVLGGPTWDAGRSCSALHFDGVDDFVSTNFKLNTPTSGSFTTDFWFRPETNNGAILGAETGIGTTNKSGSLYMLYPSGSDFTLAFGVRLMESATWGQMYTSIDAFPLGPWYHVAWVWENKTVRLYVNGVERALDSNTFPYDGNIQNPGSWYIGADNDFQAAGCESDPNVRNHFAGWIDDIRVTMAAKSASSVAADYACGFTPTPTPTPTWTDTFTLTPTPTDTLQVTSTWTPTPTLTSTATLTPTVTIPLLLTPSATPTPGLRLWPNPYSPGRAYGGTLKAERLPPGAFLNLYTVSGERVAHVPEVNGRAEWDGWTTGGVWVAPGTYYYRIEAGKQKLAQGVLVVVPDL